MPTASSNDSVRFSTGQAVEGLDEYALEEDISAVEPHARDRRMREDHRSVVAAGESLRRDSPPDLSVRGSTEGWRPHRPYRLFRPGDILAGVLHANLPCGANG